MTLCRLLVTLDLVSFIVYSLGELWIFSCLPICILEPVFSLFMLLLVYVYNPVQIMSDVFLMCKAIEGQI